MASNTQLYRWCFTLFVREGDNWSEEKEVLEGFCKKYAKHWTFQLEHTQAGNLHWQGRLSLRVKVRMAQLKEAMESFSKGRLKAPHLDGEHDLPMSELYCLKEESRVAGPWADRVPDRSVLALKLTPWQQALEDYVTKNQAHPRQVMWFYDPVGGTGKTEMAKYLRAKHNAGVHRWANARNLATQVIEGGAKPIYVFDLQRAHDADKMDAGVVEVVEACKDGEVGGQMFGKGGLSMPKPHVLVFSNQLPQADLFSPGRLRVMTLGPNDQAPKTTVPDIDLKW